MGSCTSKNQGPFFALCTVLVKLETGYMVWPLLKSSPWVTLLLWNFKGTVGLGDEIEKRKNRTLLELWIPLNVCEQDAVPAWSSCCVLLTSTSHGPALLWQLWRALLLPSLFSSNFGWCWQGYGCQPACARGKGLLGLAWDIHIIQSMSLGRWHCITVLVHILSDKYVCRIT